MSLQYCIVPNLLTDDDNVYRAAMQPFDSVDEEAVIERMIERGSTITRPDILAVLQEHRSAIISLVLEGFKVNTPLAQYSTSIKGVFTGQTDGFEPSRHSLNASTRPGKEFRRAIREQGQVQKTEGNKPAPQPLDYQDTNSGEMNATLTPGGMGRVVGYRLKFDPDDTNQGIFLTAQSNGKKPTRVEVVGRNCPSDLMFMVPNTLASGDYALSVAALFGQDDIRTGQLEATLTAPGPA